MNKRYTIIYFRYEIDSVEKNMYYVRLMIVIIEDYVLNC